MSFSSSFSPADRTRSPAEPDEDSPLLSRNHSSVFRRASLARLDNALSRSLPAYQFVGSHRSSFIARNDDIDVDDLRMDLARVGSIGSFTGEYGNPYQTIAPPPAWSKSPSRAVLDEVDEETIATGDHEEPLGEESYGQTKYMNISTRNFWIIFVVVMLCYFVSCFDSTLMASSHPVITSYFGVSQAASWLSTVFLITSTAFQPLFGRLSDTFGRRVIFCISLTIFAVTTLWCALAQTIGSFITARAICGIGAGGTMSLAMIIVSDCVRIEDRGVFQSHINLAFGLGSSSGAAFGGYLCDTIGWRWAFGIQVPVLLTCVIVAAIFVPAHLGPMFIKNGEGGAWVALQKFDFIGSVILVTNVTALILALNLGGNIYPWVSWQVITCAVIFAILTPIFIYIETRAVQPLMPMRLLTQTPVANLIWLNLVGLIATNTILFNVPLFFQAVLLTSASDAGFRLALPVLIGPCAGISTGYIITYTKRLKPTLVLGAVIYVIGSVAICFLTKETSEIVSIFLIAGVPIGQGFAFPTSLLSALAVSEQIDQAIVTTTIGLFRNLGTVLGIAISSLVFQNMLKGELEERVTGVDKRKIIHMVESSVKSIKLIKGEQMQQVIDSYEASLRITFTVAIAGAVVLFLLAVPVKLPRLSSKKVLVAHAGE